MHAQVRRGLTRTELIVVAVCVTALGVLLLITSEYSHRSRRAKARLLKNSTQIDQIYKSFVMASNDLNGRFPRPGEFDRLPVSGVNTPGRGAENATRNTTANLYSAMIMLNWFTPRICISPVERNPNVKEAVTAYDYNVYAPAKGTWWDPNFKADLAAESNVSYAHMPLYGERLKHWANAAGEDFPVIGDRGPRDGKPDPKSYTCRSDGSWSGWITPFRGARNRLTSMVPAGLFFGDGDNRKPDNLFAFDDGIDGADVILTFTKEMTGKGPVIQHD
jgi:hypothetical protein